MSISIFNRCLNVFRNIDHFNSSPTMTEIWSWVLVLGPGPGPGNRMALVLPFSPVIPYSFIDSAYWRRDADKDAVCASRVCLGCCNTLGNQITYSHIWIYSNRSHGLNGLKLIGVCGVLTGLELIYNHYEPSVRTQRLSPYLTQLIPPTIPLVDWLVG